MKFRKASFSITCVHPLIFDVPGSCIIRMCVRKLRFCDEVLNRTVVNFLARNVNFDLQRNKMINPKTLTAKRTYHHSITPPQIATQVKIKT